MHGASNGGAAKTAGRALLHLSKIYVGFILRRLQSIDSFWMKSLPLLVFEWKVVFF